MRRRDFVLARLPLVPLDMSADLRLSVQRGVTGSRRHAVKPTRLTHSGHCTSLEIYLLRPAPPAFNCRAWTVTVPHPDRWGAYETS